MSGIAGVIKWSTKRAGTFKHKSLIRKTLSNLINRKALYKLLLAKVLIDEIQVSELE